MERTKFEFILYCADQQRSTNFYQRLLLQKPVLNVPGMTEFQLTQNVKLGLMPEEGIVSILGEQMKHPALGYGIPRCELYIYTDEPEEYFKRALEIGGVAVSHVASRDWGDKVGYVSDLDGHIVAFAQCE
ncbi:MAG: lactoylglutathione lyase [Candidatus Kapaibacterium sp.]